MYIFPDNSERPIAFVWRTLSSSEQNYAQLQKEALALIFGVQKFHRYLYGRSLALITDHKLLITILGLKNGIPSLAAAWLQRWAIPLSAYHHNIIIMYITSVPQTMVMDMAFLDYHYHQWPLHWSLQMS